MRSWLYKCVGALLVFRLATAAQAETEAGLGPGEPSTEELLSLLAVGGEKERIEAARALGKKHDRWVVPALLRTLRDPADKVRYAARDALRVAVDEGSVDLLMVALCDDDTYVQDSAGRALGIIGRAAVGPLLELLEERDSWLRRRACVGFWYVFLQKQKEKLERAPKDPEWEEREKPRVVEALIGAMKDPEWKVRQKAIMALGKARDERAVGPLIKALGEEKYGPRGCAGAALSRILKERRDEALERALHDPDPMVRRGGAELGWRSKKAARLLLGALADEDAQVRENAANSLVMVFERVKPPEGAAAFLSKAARDTSARTRLSVASCLGRTRDPAALGPLSRLVRDNDPDVRIRTAHALGMLLLHRKGSTRAVPPLLAALEDEDARVRKSAAFRLKPIAAWSLRSKERSELLLQDLSGRLEPFEKIDTDGPSREQVTASREEIEVWAAKVRDWFADHIPGSAVGKTAP